MKQRPFVVAILLYTFVMIVVCPANIWAQRSGPYQSRTNRGQIYFVSGEECDAAIKAGIVGFYKPTYFNLHKKLGPGEELRPLESNQCFKMLTVKGYRWVAQAEGMEVVVKDNRVVRRYDCGNPIVETYHKDEPLPEPEPFRCPEGTTPGEQPGVCLQIVENTITEYKDKIIDNTCRAGASVPILQHSAKKSFEILALMRERLTPEHFSRLSAIMVFTAETSKATTLTVYSNGCDYAVFAENIIRKGWGIWKWIIPAAIVGAFILGYYLHPKCKACNTKVTPIKSTPSTRSPVPVRPGRIII